MKAALSSCLPALLATVVAGTALPSAAPPAAAGTVLMASRTGGTGERCRLYPTGTTTYYVAAGPIAYTGLLSVIPPQMMTPKVRIHCIIQAERDFAADEFSHAPGLRDYHAPGNPADATAVAYLAPTAFTWTLPGMPYVCMWEEIIEAHGRYGVPGDADPATPGNQCWGPLDPS